MNTKPVVFGEAQPTKKGSTMSLGNSKYLRKKKLPNPWREIVVNETILIPALEYILHQTTHLKTSEKIERVIVGEPVAGQYPLGVAIVKRKED